jgi:hypothetical protein
VGGMSAFPSLREAREVAKRLRSTRVDFTPGWPNDAHRVADYEPEDVERAAQLLVLLADELEEVSHGDL